MSRLPAAFDGILSIVLPSLWLLPLTLLLAGALQGYRRLGKLVLDSMLLRYLGRISLGIYLYHYPVWALILHLGRFFGFDSYFRAGWLTLLVGAPLTVAAAALSWHLVEQPINSLKVHFPYSRRTGRLLNSPAASSTIE
jgi:peptidoglycan/LPS O-acetylase OafA/YrhL